MSKLLSELQKLGPGASWVAAIGIAFDKMAICENEISRAQRRHPEHSEKVWGSFKLLCPCKHTLEAPEPVYRAHCAELLDRVAHGLDTTLGTRAEIMMALSAASLKSPLKHTATVLYARLFSAILPDAPILHDLEALGKMDSDRAIETLLAELSKKCRDPGRKLTKEK